MNRRKVIGMVGIATFSGCIDSITNANKSEGGGARETDYPTSSQSWPYKVECSAIEATPYFKYESENGDSLEKLYPKNELWIIVLAYIHNLTEEKIEKPPISDFSVLLNGNQYSPIRGFDEVETDRIRSYADGTLFLDLKFGEEQAEGEIEINYLTSYSLLFDTESGSDIYLSWEESDDLMGPKYGQALRD